MVTAEDAKNFREQMSKPDLVFLTRENDHKIRAKVAPYIRDEIERKEKEAKTLQDKIEKEAVKKVLAVLDGLPSDNPQ